MEGQRILSRDHEQSSRISIQLQEKLTELKMVHASEQARSVAEVEIAKQDVTAIREQNEALKHTIGDWERKYQGATDAHAEDREKLYEERAALKSEVRALEHRMSEAAVDLQAKEEKWTCDQQRHVEDTLELRAQHKIALEDAHRRATGCYSRCRDEVCISNGAVEGSNRGERWHDHSDENFP